MTMLSPRSAKILVVVDCGSRTKASSGIGANQAAAVLCNFAPREAPIRMKSPRDPLDAPPSRTGVDM